MPAAPPTVAAPMAFATVLVLAVRLKRTETASSDATPRPRGSLPDATGRS